MCQREKLLPCGAKLCVCLTERNWQEGTAAGWSWGYLLAMSWPDQDCTRPSELNWLNKPRIKHAAAADSARSDRDQADQKWHKRTQCSSNSSSSRNKSYCSVQWNAVPISCPWSHYYCWSERDEDEVCAVWSRVQHVLLSTSPSLPGFCAPPAPELDHFSEHTAETAVAMKLHIMQHTGNTFTCATVFVCAIVFCWQAQNRRWDWADEGFVCPEKKKGDPGNLCWQCNQLHKEKVKWIKRKIE